MKDTNKKEAVSGITKLDVIFRTFPLIKEFYREQSFKKVSMLPVNLDLLTKDCGYFYSYETGGNFYERNIALFDKDGTHLVTVGKEKTTIPAEPGWKLFGFIPMPGEPEYVQVRHFNETVGQAIERVGIDKVAFIVGFYSNEPGTLLFAHSGKKTVKQALEEERQLADEMLKNEIVIPVKS